MIEPETLRKAILERLSQVIDPETGVDVVRMRLIEDLHIDDVGQVTCVFRPSSPLCPIAVPLSLAIQQAIANVEGVSAAQVQVVGIALGDELTAWLKQAMANDENGASSKQ